MSLSGQRILNNSYTLIPRILAFLLRDERVLLLKLANSKGAWAGLLNGVGGHVERGETPYQTALREIDEELDASPVELRMTGILTVDPGTPPGVIVFVYVGYVDQEHFNHSPEGEPIWIDLKQLQRQKLVEDLYELLPRAIDEYRSSGFFYAHTTYAEDGQPILNFLPKDPEH